MMRQWVVAVPMPLRYWMASSQDLTATVHTIIPYPLLSGLSRRRSIVLCLAPGRVTRAAAARWVRRRNRGEGGAAGRGWGSASGGAHGGRAQECRCRVGWEVTQPDPSPDPDEEISSIRLFR